ncbi:MAG: hypothetical protein ACM3SY_12680 [Candidatus Omnitrophota bacterium]
MEIKPKKERKTDPLFDGHLEKEISQMTPKEKLLYLSRQIQLKRFVETKVRKKN